MGQQGQKWLVEGWGVCSWVLEGPHGSQLVFEDIPVLFAAACLHLAF